MCFCKFATLVLLKIYRNVKKSRIEQKNMMLNENLSIGTEEKY